jgi:hypothetical protein
MTRETHLAFVDQSGQKLSGCRYELSRRRPVWLAAVLLAGATVGCGSGNGLPVVPVSGKITFAGGPCPGPGNVTFNPLEVEPGLPRRPGSATFFQDGAFVVTSFQKGDGLVPGRYEVKITCDSGLPDPRSPDPWGDVTYIDKDYQPPELVVAAGSAPIEVNYDVTPKKKTK